MEPVRLSSLDADTFCPSGNFSYSVFKAIQSLRRNDALDLLTVAKTESEKLPLLRSRYRTLRLIHFEFELLRDESLHASHHSLSCPFAANVDIAIVRVTNKTKTPALQLSVEFVEHEIAEQRRKWTTLRSPLHARADQPVLHDPRIQECPDQFQQPLVFNALGNLSHQFVVLDSIEKFLQIEIDDPTITLRDVLLRLGHSLMSRSTWSKTVTVIRNGRVPLSLQNLHHRLLDKSNQHGRNAELAHSSIRLRYFHPPDRLWLVGPTQQLFPNGWPVLFQVVGELIDGHAVDARATFVCLHLLQCCLQILWLTYFLHQSVGSSWAFVSTCRRGRFSLFPAGFSGFTRQRVRKVQLLLDILLLVVLETHGLLTSPSRSGLQSPLPAWPICLLRLSAVGVPH